MTSMQDRTVPGGRLSRRSFLGSGLALGAAVATGVGAALPAHAGTSAKVLTIFETHSQQQISAEYWRDGWYNPDALYQFDWLLRDWRTDETTEMDPGLLDILYSVQQLARHSEPLNIICGYRSPRTNAMLAATRSGVANNSYHMYGRAADIRLPGMDTRGLNSIAVSLQAGGVGLYRRSGFVHVDTGDVRTW